MLKIAVGALCLTLFVPTTHAGKEENAAPHENVALILRAVLEGMFPDGTRFTAIVRQEPRSVPKERADLLHGVDDGSPRAVVVEVCLVLAGRRLVAPAGAVEDLSNAVLEGTLLVRHSPEGLSVLAFHGGDGAAAYDASFYFDRKALVRRELAEIDESGERVVHVSKYR